MKINDNIFKAYDIRGIYPEELNEKIAYKIGRGFSKFVKGETLMVGYDTRLSSPALFSALTKGIVDSGVNVVNIGLSSTSCFYYTLAESGLDGGIMITASHNTKEFNGFKMMLKDATPLTQEQILEIKRIVLEEDFLTVDKKGSIKKQDSMDAYIKMVRGSIKEKIKPLKVVMDAGNGMAGLYIDKVFKNISLEIVPIYTKLDGNFPNHETNPKIAENRIKLEKKIIEEKADLGFMFDGDADRVCVLDREGKVVDYSLVMAILAEYLITNSSQGKKAIIEVRTARVVRDWVERKGGEIIVSSCWTIPIKFKMKADPEVVFGGETSGHYLFRQTHESDDGIFSILTFLQAISVKDKSIDEIIKKFREKYFVLEEMNFEIESDGRAQEIMNKIKDNYLQKGAKILEIDGISAIFDDWQFNLRKSQSEPVLRLNLEANSKEIFENKKQEVINILENK